MEKSSTSMDGRVFLAVCCFLVNTAAGAKTPSSQHGNEGLPSVLHFNNAPYINTLDENFSERDEVPSSESSYRHVTRRQLCSGSEGMVYRLANAYCNQSYVEATIDLIARGDACSYALMDSPFYRCGTNHKGEPCGIFDPNFNQRLEMLEVADEIAFYCFENLREGFESCSSDCRRVLEEFSDSFGCCIYTEPLIRDDYMGMIFVPILWSKCNVTRPEPCTGTPRIPEESSAAGTCSIRCMWLQLIALECKYISREIVQLYEDCGVPEFASEIRQRCGFNAKGESCGEINLIINGNSQRNYAFSVYNQFYSTNECSTECKEALEEVSETLGCCVNNMNTTEIHGIVQDTVGASITRYDLWSTCGVETPEFCTLPTDLSVYDRLLECNTCVHEN